MPAVKTKASRPCKAAASIPAWSANPVDKIVDGKGRAGITAVQKLAHVVADAGKSLQPAIAVQKLLHLGRRHALCVMRYRTTPGSIWPVRVPMGSPSRAVKPIVLSTLRPP